MARVERLERVLEHDLDAAPLGERPRRRVRPASGAPSSDAPARRRVEPRDAAADGGLAAPGLADERDAPPGSIANDTSSTAGRAVRALR